MKQALILAAGRGMRLGRCSHGKPKCLLEVGGKTLIEHQLHELRAAGIEQICIVVGHRASEVRSVVGDGCSYVMNPIYAHTNSLYSLMLARDQIRGPFVLLNGDVLAHPEVYRRVISSDGSALAYDSSSGKEDEHMKVTFAGGRLQSISKALPANETHGENVGILSFEGGATPLLFTEAAALTASNGNMCWAPAAVGRIADRTVIHGVDIAGLPWAEIDFPDDLAFAREKVWPVICGGGLPE